MTSNLRKKENCMSGICSSYKVYDKHFPSLKIWGQQFFKNHEMADFIDLTFNSINDCFSFQRINS